MELPMASGMTEGRRLWLSLMMLTGKLLNFTKLT